jgi:oligoendopeptidase F
MFTECFLNVPLIVPQIFDSYDDSSHLWTYVSHFHNVPFYVYSYAFADLVVGSLYGVYQQSSDGFEDKLLDVCDWLIPISPVV